MIGAGGRNRTGMVLLPEDFESSASTNFTTPARQWFPTGGFAEASETTETKLGRQASQYQVGFRFELVARPAETRSIL